MPRPALFQMDIVVADAKLQDMPIKVGILVMLREGVVVWQSDVAYPLHTWALEAVAKQVRDLERVAILHWPELAGACDWWVPPAEHYDMQAAGRQAEDGQRLGMQDA